MKIYLPDEHLDQTLRFLITENEYSSKFKIAVNATNLMRTQNFQNNGHLQWKTFLLTLKP